MWKIYFGCDRRIGVGRDFCYPQPGNRTVVEPFSVERMTNSLLILRLRREMASISKNVEIEVRIWHFR